MRKVIIIAFAFLLGCGCTHKESKSSYSKEQISSLNLDSTKIFKIENTSSPQVVDLEPFLEKRQYSFADLVKSLKYISLETSSVESLLADIQKVIVTDTYIYIMDRVNRNRLTIFQRSGKFVKRIAKGKGPKELSRLYDISYYKKTRELIAYEHSNLAFFTPEGEFIRKERLPIGFHSFMALEDGYLLKTLDRQGNSHLGNLEDFHLFLTDKKFSIQRAALNRPPFGKVIEGTQHLHIGSDNNVIITENYNDSIYSFSNGKLEVLYTLDYSKKKLPSKYLYEESYSKFHEILESDDYYYYLGDYWETDTHNIFGLSNSSNIGTDIYRDKKTGNLAGGCYAMTPKEEMNLKAMVIGVFENFFVGLYEPSVNDIKYCDKNNLISEEDKEKIKKFREDDNPMLVFFELKPF